MVSEHTPERPIRLIVVDDDAGIRTLLEVTISLDPRFELAGAAASGAECTAMCSALDAVDVVLLDVSLPDADGIDLLGRVRTASGDAKVALFTGWSDAATLARARDAGADAVFPKNGEPRRLLDGIADLVGRA